MSLIEPVGPQQNESRLPVTSRWARIRKILPVIGFNTILTLAIWGFFLTFPAITSLAYKNVRDALGDPRPNLPNYSDVSWAEQHFKESAGLSTDYFDYYVWRRSPFQGETITISEEGIRLTSKSSNTSNLGSVWVMGGSTIWGTGVQDSDTIPSHLALGGNLDVTNLGESGYRIRQSFNFFLHRLSVESPPDILISYDGFNDVHLGCLSANPTDNSGQEQEIRARVSENVFSLSYLLVPAVNFFQEVTARFGRSELASDSHLCHIDLQRAHHVAEQIVRDWAVIKYQAESQGVVFVPVLQPTLATSDSRRDHLSDISDLAPQFESVYPLVLLEAERRGIDVLDLTSALDDDAYYFIDVVHIDAVGNRIIAEALLRHLSTTSANR